MQQQQQQQKETKLIFILGESQTCKSSIIQQFQTNDQNVEKQQIPIGKLGAGQSCTQQPEAYFIKTQSGQQIFLVDTKGLLDSKTFDQDEAAYKSIYRQICTFINKFVEYNVNKVYFALTECLENSTIQITKNIAILYKLFGTQGLESTLVLYTKYNPQLLDIEYVKQQVELRINQIIEEVQQFEQKEGKQFNMKFMKFHTKIFSNKSIPELPLQFFKEQEQTFLENLQQLKPFNFQILKEYENYCNQRIYELSQQEGIGIQTVEETINEPVEIIQQVPIEVKHGIFKKKKTVYVDKIIMGNKEKKKTKQVQLKSLDQIKEMFFTDSIYQKEKEDKIEEIINNL